MSNQSFRKVLQYLWDSEPVHNDLDSKIVVLGIEHDPKGATDKATDVASSSPADSGGDTQETSNGIVSNPWPVSFLSDVDSRMWLTYRTGFPLIPKAKQGPSTISIGGILRGSGIDLHGFTSDVGWGCMIRTAQSLLANALMMLELGRNWRRTPGDPCEAEKRIALLFLDEPSAPFSIHKIVAHGEAACGKMPGEWFGPSAAASSIKHLCEQHNGPLRVYSASGSDLFENKLLSVAKGPRKNDSFHPTLILLGVRLGIDKVNEIYYDTLKSFFDCPQSVGIAGGRPSASHYFYGYQGNNLLYLDPHQPRPKLSTTDAGVLQESSIESIHTKRIRLLNLSEMDPSMLVGFLVKNEDDFKDWKQRMTDPANKYNIINFFSSEPQILRRTSLSATNDDEFIDVGLEDGLDTGCILSDECETTSEADINDQAKCEIPKPSKSQFSGEEHICGSYVSVDRKDSIDLRSHSYSKAPLVDTNSTSSRSFSPGVIVGPDNDDQSLGNTISSSSRPDEEEPVMIGSYISNADGEEWEEMIGSLRATTMRSVSYSNGHGKSGLGRTSQSSDADVDADAESDNSDDDHSANYSHDEFGIGAGNIEI